MAADELDLVSVISSLENKRAILDSAIAALRAVVSSGAGTSPDGAINNPMSFAGSSSGEIPDGAFHGKSMPAAIRLYLELVRSKKTSKEVAEGLKKGGLESTSRFYEKIVYATLDRLRKSGDVIKVGGAWGLPSWFPALMRASAGAGTKAKIAKPRKPQLRRFPRLKASAAIDLYLQKNPGPHTDEEIRTGTNISNLRVTQMVLGTLAKKGKVAKTEDGKYEYRKAS